MIYRTLSRTKGGVREYCSCVPYHVAQFLERTQPQARGYQHHPLLVLQATEGHSAKWHHLAGEDVLGDLRVDTCADPPGSQEV